MAGGAYGQGAGGGEVMVMAPGSMEPAAVTDVAAAALKQLTEPWWWFTELRGLTDQGNVLAPSGLGTCNIHSTVKYGTTHSYPVYIVGRRDLNGWF